MRLSKAVKQTLGNDEQIKKLFSYSNQHIYVRLAFSLLKWALISIIIAAIVVVLYKIGESASKGSLQEAINLNGANIANEKFFQDFLIRVSAISAFIFIIIFLPFSLFYHLYFLKVSNTYVLTDRRVIVKKGWLNTSVKSVDYDRITDIEVNQSFLDKIIYASGTLSISTAGGDGYEIALRCIDKPHELKKILSDLKEEYRKKIYPQTIEKKAIN